MCWYLPGRVLAPRKLTVLLGEETRLTLDEMGQIYIESVCENSQKQTNEDGVVSKVPGSQVGWNKQTLDSGEEPVWRTAFSMEEGRIEWDREEMCGGSRGLK